MKNGSLAWSGLSLDLLLHHLRLVDGEFLEPCHGWPQLPDPLCEVVTVEVGGAVADPPEEITGDIDATVVEIWTVFPVKLLLKSL
jgi:hypothetical protein